VSEPPARESEPGGQRLISARHQGPTIGRPRRENAHEVLQVLGAGWTMTLLEVLADRGAARFGDLHAALPGLGPKRLTQTLRRLEAWSLVSRTVHAEAPPRVEYRLTGVGAGAARALRRLQEWAESTFGHGSGHR
jgi:DNA-binding HxlR family transcriptional regulator